MNSIHNLLKLSKSTYIVLFLSSLIALLEFTNIVYPYLYGQFFDAIDSKKYQYLYYLYAILIYFVVTFLLDLIFMFLFIKYKERVRTDIDLFVSEKILSVDQDKLKNKGEGYFSSLIESSISNIVNIVEPDFIISLFSVVKVSIILVILYRIEFTIALIILIWLILQGILYKINNKFQERYFKGMLETNNQHNALSVKRFFLNQLARLYPGIASSFANDIEQSVKKLTCSEIKNEVYSSVFAPLIGKKLEPLLRVLVLFILSSMLVMQKISLGNMVAAITYFLMITTQIELFSSAVSGYIAAKSSAERMGHFLRECGEKKISVSPASPSNFIELHNFSLKIIQKTMSSPINLILPTGNIYSLTGENGLGKSSFVKCIHSQFEDYGGSIRIGGYDLTEYQVNINYIAQDDLLIDDYSLEDNITMKTERADQRYVEKIIQHLQIEYLGNRSDMAKLSGGEKRKVILARFLYYLKEHDFFILDEVFVALDRDYLGYVLPIVKKYIQGKSGIVISHHLAVIHALCDSNALDCACNHHFQSKNTG